MRRISRPCVPRLHTIAVVLVAAAQIAGADDKKLVEVTGGVDESGQNYRWRVVNRHASPIVALSFPQHNADTFLIGDGWETEIEKWSGPINLGGTERFNAKATTPQARIRPGQATEVYMRISRRGSARGWGDAKFVFADGTEFTVPDVESPRGPSFGELYGTPLAMVAILGIIAIVHLRRRSLAKRAAEAEPETSE